MKQASTPMHIYREENATEFLPGWHLPALPTTLARLLLLRNSQAGRKEKRRQIIKILFQNETYLKQITTHAASQAG